MTQYKTSLLTQEQFTECRLLIGDALTYYYSNEKLRNDHSEDEWANLNKFKRQIGSDYAVSRSLEQLIIKRKQSKSIYDIKVSITQLEKLIEENTE